MNYLWAFTLLLITVASAADLYTPLGRNRITINVGQNHLNHDHLHGPYLDHARHDVHHPLIQVHLGGHEGGGILQKHGEQQQPRGWYGEQQQSGGWHDNFQQNVAPIHRIPFGGPGTVDQQQNNYGIKQQIADGWQNEFAQQQQANQYQEQQNLVNKNIHQVRLPELNNIPILINNNIPSVDIEQQQNLLGVLQSIQQNNQIKRYKQQLIDYLQSKKQHENQELVGLYLNINHEPGVQYQQPSLSGLNQNIDQNQYQQQELRPNGYLQQQALPWDNNLPIGQNVQSQEDNAGELLNLQQQADYDLIQNLNQNQEQLENVDQFIPEQEILDEKYYNDQDINQNIPQRYSDNGYGINQGIDQNLYQTNIPEYDSEKIIFQQPLQQQLHYEPVSNGVSQQANYQNDLAALKIQLVQLMDQRYNDNKNLIDQFDHMKSEVLQTVNQHINQHQSQAPSIEVDDYPDQPNLDDPELNPKVQEEMDNIVEYLNSKIVTLKQRYENLYENVVDNEKYSDKPDYYARLEDENEYLVRQLHVLKDIEEDFQRIAYKLPSEYIKQLNAEINYLNAMVHHINQIIMEDLQQNRNQFALDESIENVQHQSKTYNTGDTEIQLRKEIEVSHLDRKTMDRIINIEIIPFIHEHIQREILPYVEVQLRKLYAGIIQALWTNLDMTLTRVTHKDSLTYQALHELAKQRLYAEDSLSDTDPEQGGDEEFTVFKGKQMIIDDDAEEKIVSFKIPVRDPHTKKIKIVPVNVELKPEKNGAPIDDDIKVFDYTKGLRVLTNDDANVFVKPTIASRKVNDEITGSYNNNESLATYHPEQGDKIKPDNDVKKDQDNYQNMFRNWFGQNNKSIKQQITPNKNLPLNDDELVTGPLETGDDDLVTGPLTDDKEGKSLVHNLDHKNIRQEIKKPDSKEELLLSLNELQAIFNKLKLSGSAANGAWSPGILNKDDDLVTGTKSKNTSGEEVVGPKADKFVPKAVGRSIGFTAKPFEEHTDEKPTLSTTEVPETTAKPFIYK